jgi:predicted regulator of amino acid metabolism with ACT domain
MMNAELTIDSPAYQYFGEDALNSEVEIRLQQLKKADYNRRLPVKYRTITQMEEEKQELEIAEEINSIQTMQDLSRLLREGQLKEFYRLTSS